MRRLRALFLASLHLFPLCRSPGSTAGASPPPNIVFVLADDLGITDINAYATRFTGSGTEAMYYETPNLNRLAKEGVAFAQAYACPLCSPTRSSILTGKYAARLGFTTAVGGNVKTFYNQGRTPPPGYLVQDALYWGDNLPLEQALLNATTIDAMPSGQPLDQGRDEITIAEALTGHRSAFIGKWHVGGHGARGYQPSNQRFEEISFFDEGGSPYFKWRGLWDSRKKIFETMPQPELLRGKAGTNYGHEYLTDELTEHAVQYLRSRGSESAATRKPFFLYLCHFAVHAPWQGRPDYIAAFEQKPTRGWNGHDNPAYAAMLKSLDDSVGRLLDVLSETGLDDSTIFVFMSDNGGVSWATRPGEKPVTSNAPFTGGKAMLFEGGIRVPLIVRWKGQLPQNQWCQRAVDANDLFPTLLELCGYDPRPHYSRIDGRSFASLLRRPEARGDYARDTFFWHYPLNVIVPHPDDNLPVAPHSAVRVGDHKLIFDWSGTLKLFNIKKDPFERTDLARKEPEKALKLFRRLNDWIDAEVPARYTPALNPNYNPAKEARPRPFVDLRKKYLGEDRAIRRVGTDPRLAEVLAAPGG